LLTFVPSSLPDEFFDFLVEEVGDTVCPRSEVWPASWKINEYTSWHGNGDWVTTMPLDGWEGLI